VIHPGFALRKNPQILVIDTDTKDPQTVEQQYKKPRSAAVDRSTEPSLKTMYHRSSTYNVERQPTHAISSLPDLHRNHPLARVPRQDLTPKSEDEHPPTERRTHTEADRGTGASWCSSGHGYRSSSARGWVSYRRAGGGERFRPRSTRA
jgi:hypothetical protein